MRLLGRTAVITGAGKGIGPAIAVKLASEGADLALIARDRAALDELSTEIVALGRRCSILVADLRRADEVDRAFSEIATQLNGCLDILVNVAGVRGPVDKPLWQMSESEFDEL